MTGRWRSHTDEIGGWIASSVDQSCSTTIFQPYYLESLNIKVCYFQNFSTSIETPAVSPPVFVFVHLGFQREHPSMVDKGERRTL